MIVEKARQLWDLIFWGSAPRVPVPVPLGEPCGGGGAGSSGYPSESNGGAGECFIIESDLEDETRRLAELMVGPGERPTESEWGIFFFRGGGSVRGEADRVMRMAHRLARASRSGTQEFEPPPELEWPYGVQPKG